VFARPDLFLGGEPEPAGFADAAAALGFQLELIVGFKHLVT
jgi:hypothetical protein